MTRARFLRVAALVTILATGCSSQQPRRSAAAHPTSSPTAAVISTPAPTVGTSATATPSAASPGWRIGPQAVRVNLMFATGTPEGLYGVEPSGDGPPFKEFRLVRIDPATLQVRRSAVLTGDPGGFTVDNQAVYVGVTGSRSVLRFTTDRLNPMQSWRDPIARLRGPLAVTRMGLWVADVHGLTRLLGDGSEAGTSTQHWPYTVLLQAGWDEPGLLANSFWAVADDRHGCPTLYTGSGPNGLEGHPSPVLHPVDCGLGFGRITTGPGGTVVSVLTGLMARTQLLQLDAVTARWTAHPGPAGSNGIQPSVAGNQLFVSDVRLLDCVDRAGRVLATLQLGETQALPQLLEAGGREFIVFTEGDIGAANGPRVQPFSAPRACH